jgi:hypothetical protein
MARVPGHRARRVTRALLLGAALVAASLVAQGCGSSHSSSSTAVSTFELTPKSGTALADATTAAPYQQVFTVLNGGTPPYTFTPISIPAGLTLTPAGTNGTDALLSGTPTKMGQAVVSFQVVDSTNRKFSNESYPLNVH